MTDVFVDTELLSSAVYRVYRRAQRHPPGAPSTGSFPASLALLEAGRESDQRKFAGCSLPAVLTLQWINEGYDHNRGNPFKSVFDKYNRPRNIRISRLTPSSV